MNARSQVFELALEWRQVEEAVLSIFHTVIFHRSYGKFTYQSDSSYFVGTLGFEDVDCDFIDATYVRTSSSELDAALRSALANFAEDLRKLGEGKHPSTTGSGSLSSTGGGSAPAHLGAGAGGLGSGQVSLEFFQKRRRWPFAPDYIPWEVSSLLCFTLFPFLTLSLSGLDGED